jgi:hypothetical protein
MTLSIADPATTRNGALAVNWGRFTLVGLGTIGAAVLANVIVFFICGMFVAYDPQFLPLANVGAIVIFTVFPAIIATLIYALLLRFTQNPARLFTIIAVIALLISLVPDLTYIPTVPGVTTAQTAVLLLMHLVAATVIVGMLTRSRPQARSL